MSAFLIANIDVTDPEGFAVYRTLVSPTIDAAGGRYLVRGGETRVLEGDWRPSRVVLLEFPSMDDALAWYESDAYSEARALRQRTARSDVVLVAGVPGA
jgi:uncharacterized protein (DUF1330 family)